jgi:FkbM family methyltransferase
MSDKKFPPHRPFEIKTLPQLAKFYCKAYHSPANQWQLRGLKAAFSIFHSLGLPASGKFTYERFGQKQNVHFNGRNLQFQSLYAPFWKNGYEFDVQTLIDFLVPEDGVFFDIGSNWGYFTLYAASQRKKLTIHAFEAHNDTYHDLVSCVTQAGITNIATCHNVALSNSDGEAFIDLPDGLHSGQATVSENKTGEKIVTRQLDGMNLPPPDLLKIDVEGHELEVLKGAGKILRKVKPFIVFENKPDDAGLGKCLEPLYYLTELGYELFSPILRRQQGLRCFNLPAAINFPIGDDKFVLVKLKPEDRLLLQPDLNVLACHKSRLQTLTPILDT